ncbi:hypothetical protein HS088_TW04G01492 [Tripterygium wilfordii]|uniref:Uncharacterized protein n=1 Tax=Tripterygium wilfordii TaxID=458696 RepID=A0A7J7DT96_TRIWF|nr:hypothetical protein HS088_TW04G01492 [Tripterygium wilfordii]
MADSGKKLREKRERRKSDRREEEEEEDEVCVAFENECSELISQIWEKYLLSSSVSANFLVETHLIFWARNDFYLLQQLILSQMSNGRRDAVHDFK